MHMESSFISKMFYFMDPLCFYYSIISKKESGARGVFQSMCLQILDPNREIDLNQIDWISSCSLPNSCLPGSLFRMTNQKSSRGIIFESCMETQFPITALLIAVGSGLDLTLNDFVFDDYLSFGNALSVALAQEPFLSLSYFPGRTGLTCLIGQ